MCKTSRTGSTYYNSSKVVWKTHDTDTRQAAPFLKSRRKIRMFASVYCLVPTLLYCLRAHNDTVISRAELQAIIHLYKTVPKIELLKVL